VVGHQINFKVDLNQFFLNFIKICQEEKLIKNQYIEIDVPRAKKVISKTIDLIQPRDMHSVASEKSNKSKKRKIIEKELSNPQNKKSKNLGNSITDKPVTTELKTEPKKRRKKDKIGNMLNNQKRTKKKVKLN
jgi:hypothetical protein